MTTSASASAQPTGVEPLTKIFTAPSNLVFRKIERLPEDKRSWRAQQCLKAEELWAQAVDRIKACQQQWNEEKAYQATVLFLDFCWHCQGCFVLDTASLPHFSWLITQLQERRRWQVVGGRRTQVDQSSAHHALRVTASSLLNVLTNLQMPEPRQKVRKSCAAALDALGDPTLAEHNLGAADIAALARGPSALVALRRNDLLAIMMMKGLFDIDMSRVKYLLNYCVARAAKMESVMTPVVADDDTAGQMKEGELACAYLEASLRMVELCPNNPLASFMAAEALAWATNNSAQALVAMRAAETCCEARGDDLMQWLAALYVAELLVRGAAGGATCSEEEVRKILARAKALEAGLKAWDGHVYYSGRCRSVKRFVKERLAAGRGEVAGQVKVWTDDPTCAEEVDGSCWHPADLPLRECSACHQAINRTLTCSACNCAQYCSKECQIKDWPGHKAACKAKLRELAAAAKKGAKKVA